MTARGRETGHGPVLLDGARLSAERAPGLAARAAAVTRERGRAPRLGLVAFEGDDGGALYIPRKVRACTAAGIAVIPEILPSSADTDRARGAVAAMVEAESPDAVFVEFPFPAHVDGDAVVAAVPESLDVDVMTDGRTRRYLEDAEGPPPLTVSAALALLDAYDIGIAGLRGVVVAEAFPFTVMFSQALARRGARMAPILPPESADLAERVGEAGLVVVAASSPGLLSAADLAAGAVVIDAGYFNPGGRGDIDTTAGTGHLRALAPVPGAIGPMTVSMLVERVIEFARERPA